MLIFRVGRGPGQWRQRPVPRRIPVPLTMDAGDGDEAGKAESERRRGGGRHQNGETPHSQLGALPS